MSAANEVFYVVMVAVSALHAVRRKLKDPMNHLQDWKKTDPCASNWTGVFCIADPSDGYLHVKELLLSGNQLTGTLPQELGSLSNLLILQIDYNGISGDLPTSLANLKKLKHFHMNNNSITGQIPPEYSSLSDVLHFLMDNNKLTGYLPPELSQMASLKIIDLSSNKLTGEIPNKRFSGNITTINLYNNMLNGSIPSNFSGLARLQRLLYGNPVCARVNEPNIADLCGVSTAVDVVESPGSSSDNSSSTGECKRQSCPVSENYEYVIGSPVPCFCAAPIGIGLRLRSPSFSDFRPYTVAYMLDVASNLGINLYQLSIESFSWQSGPRLAINMKVFPDLNSKFNSTELPRIVDFFATFSLDTDDSLGPYEIIYINLLGPYKDVTLNLYPSKSGMSKGVKIGIIVGGTIAFFLGLSFLALLLFFIKRKAKHVQQQQEPIPKSPMNMESVKGYNFMELDTATSSFSDLSQIGRGGYGKVYRGHLPCGLIVAVKRAEQGSLQGQKEFYTEIELLSRLHHRNLVSLLGYCDQKGEQMLVYEFMPNGSLQDALSARFREPLSFGLRLRIALGSARGILYLHTEADPPIIHRDIKPSNILLDNKMNPKVADFGISKLIALDGGGVQRDHVTTIVKGTPGYVDPEYYLSHRLTEKSDVYSMGIVFLEILTGMRPISHGRNIVREVKEAWEAGMMLSVIDESMGQDYSEEGVKRFMELAIRCCRDDPVERPGMLEIVRELENLFTKEEKPYSSPSVQSSASGFFAAGLGSYNNHSTFSQFTANELVSGVIPSIAPR
uniref:non-specific serine/threonine protein kinase n=1 Tax=Brassica campestris TaxID=3711 RepID=M4CN72_BRACM